MPVKVHYEGKLTTGEVFDSSHGRDALSVDIGTGRVIKGWDVGVMSMHLGEKAELTCSPDYAYGAEGSPPKIPANATLIFTVELVEQDGIEMGAIPDEEIIKNAEADKALGNEAVKNKDY
jgi:FK506-binding protein 4/5